MNKEKLEKLVRDVKKILVLAKSAYDHLEKNKIRKAKRELKRVINYDVDEITRLHGEIENGAIPQLLSECGIILKDAKEALRNLDSFVLVGDVKQLIDEIIKLEKNELIELNEEEKKEKDLFWEWTYLLDKFELYHGTISTRLKSIQQKGLDPKERERFYKEGNLKRFIQLISKAEARVPYQLRNVFTLLNYKDKVEKQVHLTFYKERAIYFAKKMGVETFYQVKEARDEILKSDKLTAQEKHEAQKIARPFINELQLGKPVVLHISLRAPALNIPWLQSFEKYKQFILEECEGRRPWFNPESFRYHPMGQVLHEVVVRDKIPYKFIKVEYV